MKCEICGLPIDGDSIGCGDGTGQKFAHPDCYWEAKYLVKCLEMQELQENHLCFLNTVNAGIDRILEKQSENRLLREQVTVQINDLTDMVHNMGRN